MRRFVCGLAMLAAFVLPAAADTPIIIDGINGQFSPPEGVLGTTFFDTDDPAIADWTITKGTVDWIGTYWHGPTSDSFSVDLDGSSPGGITSKVGLAAGLYELTFYLAGNPEWNDRESESSTKYLNVTVGTWNTELDVAAQFSTTEESASSDHPWDLVWTPEKLYFTVGNSGNAYLSFTSLDTNASDHCGPVVGDVSLIRFGDDPVHVPEAGFYSAFALNLGGLLLFVRRRRKA
jgi:hypothetical protein